MGKLLWRSLSRLLMGAAGCATRSCFPTSTVERRLLDFLNAQSEYRSVELNYVTLVGSYLTASAQLNLAVGREVIQ